MLLDSSRFPSLQHLSANLSLVKEHSVLNVHKISPFGKWLYSRSASKIIPRVSAPGSGQVPSHTRPSRGKLLMLIPRIGWWCVCVGPLLVKQQPARQGGVTCVVLAGSSRKPPGLRLATTQVRSPEPCSGDQADLTIDRKGSLVWDDPMGIHSSHYATGLSKAGPEREQPPLGDLET